MNLKQKLGKFGEELSCEFLKKNNHIIVEKNFTCTQGEIDIIAYDNKSGETVFVEVKTRRNFNYGIPSESVTKSKQKHLKKAIQYYLYKNKLEDAYVRIDIIEIVFNKKCYKLNHLKKVLE